MTPEVLALLTGCCSARSLPRGCCSTVAPSGCCSVSSPRHLDCCASPLPLGVFSGSPLGSGGSSGNLNSSVLNQAGLWIRIRMDPDPHGSGSAFIFPPGSGSGSRKVNMSTKNKKNVRKLLITASFLQVNLHKLHCFLLLSNF